MVARRIRDQFPDTEQVVQRNPQLTETQTRDSVVGSPSQWGDDPAFRFVDASEEADGYESEYDGEDDEEAGDFERSLDPRLPRA